MLSTCCIFPSTRRACVPECLLARIYHGGCRYTLVHETKDRYSLQPTKEVPINGSGTNFWLARPLLTHVPSELNHTTPESLTVSNGLQVTRAPRNI